MKENARRLLFTNCTVWTGDVGSAAAREVLVEGSRIASVAPVVAADRKQDAVVVDCGGATLMPGSSWRRQTLSIPDSCRWRSIHFRQCTMLGVFSSVASRRAWGRVRPNRASTS